MAVLPLWRVMYVLKHDDGERRELRKAFVAAQTPAHVAAKLAAALNVHSKWKIEIQQIYTHLETVYT